MVCINLYSLDLRQKIIEAYQNSEGSQRQLTIQFKVSLWFIQNRLNCYCYVALLKCRILGFFCYLRERITIFVGAIALR